MKPIIYISIGAILGLLLSQLSSNFKANSQNQSEISQDKNTLEASIAPEKAYDRSEFSEIAKLDFIPEQNEISGSSRKISALEARELQSNYERSSLEKLKAVNSAGKLVDLESIIIDKKTIDELIETIEKEPKKSRHEFLGIALTPAIKKVEVNSSLTDVHTFIVTALVTDAVGKAAPNSTQMIHYLPNNETEKTVIYDYIDLCPHTCPTNQPQIENGSWTIN